jgi:hypothetical protein
VRGIGLEPAAETGDAHGEELVEVRRDDPAELDALEQRQVRIGCEREDASVPVEPRQLAVQVAVRRA